jgi:CTD small phosphatase-like protein 2
MQGRKERNSDAVGKVLFKKTSRLEKKPVVKTQLASVVTRVPRSSAERQARRTPSVPDDLQGQRERIYREHLHHTFQALKVFKTLPSPDPIKLKQKQLSLPMRPGYAGKKTMIFDLDETLIHCSDDLETSAVVLPIRFPTGEVIRVRCR